MHPHASSKVLVWGRDAPKDGASLRCSGWMETRRCGGRDVLRSMAFIKLRSSEVAEIGHFCTTTSSSNLQVAKDPAAEPSPVTRARDHHQLLALFGVDERRGRRRHATPLATRSKCKDNSVLVKGWFCPGNPERHWTHPKKCDDGQIKEKASAAEWTPWKPTSSGPGKVYEISLQREEVSLLCFVVQNFTRGTCRDMGEASGW